MTNNNTHQTAMTNRIVNQLTMTPLPVNNPPLNSLALFHLVTLTINSCQTLFLYIIIQEVGSPAMKCHQRVIISSLVWFFDLDCALSHIFCYIYRVFIHVPILFYFEFSYHIFSPFLSTNDLFFCELEDIQIRFAHTVHRQYAHISLLRSKKNSSISKNNLSLFTSNTQYIFLFFFSHLR